MEWEPPKIATALQSDPPGSVDASSPEPASSSTASLAIPANPEVLWERFHEELRAFIAKRVAGQADADDLLQAIYLRIHTTLSRQIEPIEIAHPRGWIFQVARSVLIDHLRAVQAKNARISRGVEGNPADPELVAELDDGSDEEVEATLVGCLGLVLDTIPEPYREALVWTELNNMSQREAATKAGISISGMKSRVQRGRTHLKDAMLACCDIQLDRRRHPIACERRPSSPSSPEPQEPAKSECRGPCT